MEDLIKIYKIDYDKDENKQINGLIISHNSRIRCWLHGLKPEYFDNLLKIYSTNNIRLKNCAILKLEINKKKVTLSLVYEGYVNKRKKGKYYTNNQNDFFNDVIFEPINLELNIFGISELDIGNNHYNFYIMRHAEATHNSNKYLKQIDPELTFKGFNNGGEQSTRAGYFLKEIFTNSSNNFFFISKLRRTKQTLSMILPELDLDKKSFQITVLPCTHEIKYYPGGKCEFRTKSTPSDTMICKENELTNCSTNKNNSCCNLNQYPINWNYYLDFYKNNKQYSNINMIKLVFDFIKSNL
jgi:broad specificity phosphatase PhoE